MAYIATNKPRSQTDAVYNVLSQLAKPQAWSRTYDKLREEAHQLELQLHLGPQPHGAPAAGQGLRKSQTAKSSLYVETEVHNAAANMRATLKVCTVYHTWKTSAMSCRMSGLQYR